MASLTTLLKLKTSPRNGVLANLPSDKKLKTVISAKKNMALLDQDELVITAF